MLRSIEAATHAWLDQMVGMQRADVAFAAKVAASHTPQEVVAFSAEWLAKRVDSLVAVQHRLLDLWLERQARILERDCSNIRAATSDSTEGERTIAPPGVTPGNTSGSSLGKTEK